MRNSRAFAKFLAFLCLLSVSLLLFAASPDMGNLFGFEAGKVRNSGWMRLYLGVFLMAFGRLGLLGFQHARNVGRIRLRCRSFLYRDIERSKNPMEFRITIALLETFAFCVLLGGLWLVVSEIVNWFE